MRFLLQCAGAPAEISTEPVRPAWYRKGVQPSGISRRSPMEQTVEAIAKYLNGRLIGDGGTLIHGVNTIEAAQAGELSFADNPRLLAQALTTPASAVIVSADVGELGGKSGIGVANPKLAFALVLDLFHPSV